jgi:hypothetical protein
MTNEIKSFYDIEDLNEEEIKSVSSQRLEELLEEAKEEQKELMHQYTNGDRLCYPPDWYDSYIAPVDWIVSKIEWEIEERSQDENC